MNLHIDCKGVLDLTYAQNVSGLTKHVSVRACFLHDLKEANLVLCVWIPMNVPLHLYEQHHHTIV